MKIRIPLSLLLTTLITQNPAWAQTTLSWRSEALNGTWSDANNWWNGTGTQSPPGSESLQFDNAVQTTMSNDLTGTPANRYRILFNAGSGARTISGTTANTFYDFGGNAPKIENQSANAQTLSFPMALGYTFMQVNPVNADLTLNGNLNLGANQLRVYGNNAKNLTFGSSAILSGTGGMVAINENSTVIYQSAHNYSGDTFINAGALQLNSGAVPGTGTLRLGDITGTAAATLALGSVTGGQTLTNVLNVRSGSSGFKTITNLAASGANTISGSVYLDADATLGVASGGSLTLSGATVDLKNQTLTLSNAGNVTISAPITNSTGSGKLTKWGSGTLTLSASNSFSGAVSVNDGTLTLSHNNALGSSPGITVTTRTGGSGLTGTRITLNNVSVGSGYSLSLAGNVTGDLRSTFYAGASSNYWGGPITLNGSGSILFAAEPAGTVLNVGGTVTGNSFVGTMFLRGTSGAGYLGGVVNIGTAAVAKADNSTWTISSTGNTWASTAVSVGTVKLGANNALPVTAPMTLGQNPVGIGGTLDLAGFNQQVAGLVVGSTNASLQRIGNSSTTSDSILTFNTGTSSFGGIIQDRLGAGTRKVALTVAGGTLTLTTNVNTYSGATTVAGGTLKLGIANALPAATDVMVQNTGTFDLNGFDDTVNTLTLQAGSTIKTSSGSPTLSLASSGKAIDLTGTLGATPPATITLKLTSATGGDVTLTNGTAAVTVSSTIDLGATNRVFNVADVVSGTDLFMNGDVKGAGGMIKTGTGTLKLDSTTPKTYTGDTEVREGTVVIQNKIEVIGDDNLLKITGGTFNLSTATDTVAQVTMTLGAVTGGANTLLKATNFQFQAGTVTAYLGDKAGTTATLNKTGSGTVTISGAHTYSGDTTISDGTLKLAGGNTIPDGPGKGNVIVTGSGILDIAGQTETINGLSGNGTVDNTSGTGNYTFTVGNNDVSSTFSGIIKNTSGTLALTKWGTNSTLTLSGANTFTGNVVVKTGAVVAAHSQALGISTKVVDLTSGSAGRAQLHLDGTAGPVTLAAGISYKVSNNLGVLFNDAGNNTINGPITITSGGGDSAFYANSGLLTLAGNIAPDITGRNLLLHGVATGVISGVIADGPTTSVLSSVKKNDSGIWLLSGANTYVNGTTINAGKLVGVTGGSSQSTFTVASGATNGIQLAAANGQWSCKGMTFNSGTTYLDFDLGAMAPSATTAPMLVNGNLAFSGTCRFLLRAGTTTAGTYPLLAYTGTLSGSLPSAVYALAITGMPHASGSLSNDASGKVIYVTLSANQPLFWAASSGTWDINSSSNWKDAAGTATKYLETTLPGDQVVFEDSQSGGTPITVTVNTQVSPGSITVSNISKSYTLAGTGGVTGSVGFVKAGTGTLSLLNAGNAWSGATTIQNGTLQVGDGGLTGSLPDVPVVNQGVLVINSSNNFTLTKPLSGSGTLRKQSDGTLTLSATNTFSGPVTTGSGTPTSGGILRVLNSYALGDGSVAKTVSVIRAEVRLEGGVSIPAGIAFETSAFSLVTGLGTNFCAFRNVSSTNTVQGPVTAIGGAGGSEYTSDAGRLVLAGDVTLGTVSSRSVILSGAGDGTVNGVLRQQPTNTLSVEKKGVGTWTLTGNSTYTGVTTISGGVLALNGSGSISNSVMISIANGASLNITNLAAGFFPLAVTQTLKGNGTVVGNVVVHGTLAAGASIGTLTNVGNVVWAPGGTNEIEIGTAISTPGTGWDFLSITGALSVIVTNNTPNPADRFTLRLKGFPSGSIASFDNSANYTWPIATATATNGVVGFNAGKFNLDTNGITENLNGGTFSVVLLDQTVAIQFTPASAPCTHVTEATFFPSSSNTMVMVFTNYSGLSSVQALTLSNCNLQGIAYDVNNSPLTPNPISPILLTERTNLPAGTKKVVLVATKIDSGSAAVNALVLDACGRGKSFDPVTTTLTVTSGNLVQQRFGGLIAAEHYLHVVNGTPGLKWLEVNLNGRVFRLDPLTDGQEVSADLFAAMHEGDNNVVVLTGAGDIGTSALVMITDTPSGNLVALPEIVTLTLNQTTEGLVLSWPDTLTGWELQASGSADAGWAGLALAPVSVDGRFTVTVPSASSAQFYRLAGPAPSATRADAATVSARGAGISVLDTQSSETTQRTYDGLLW